MNVLLLVSNFFLEERERNLPCRDPVARSACIAPGAVRRLPLPTEATEMVATAAVVAAVFAGVAFGFFLLPSLVAVRHYPRRHLRL